jgi:ABC-type phosphate transport system substrate-binding protein
MKTRNRLLASLLLAAAAALWNTSSEAGPDPIVVIVNPQNPIKAVEVGDLRPIFQTTKTSWGNSAGDALPINLPEDNPLRQEFDKAVLGLDSDRVARYWQDRKIRGGARPPARLSSTGAVLKGVAAKPGAVGYVKSSEVNGTVKVVAKITDGKLSAP